MALWQRLFGSSGKEVAVQHPLRMDVHSHLIPGIDDGAQTLEESIELIRGLVDNGIKKIVTTPHILHGSYNNTPAIIRAGLEKLKPELVKAGINVQMECAAEYYFDDYFLKELVAENLITFSGRHVLFELPVMMKPPQLEDAIFEMNMRGYTPILAHPERYTYLHGPKLEFYDRIRTMGALLQVNLLSITGYYSKPIQKAARDLISAEMVDLVGTDMHNKRHLEHLPAALADDYTARLLNKTDLLNHKLFNA